MIRTLCAGLILGMCMMISACSSETTASTEPSKETTVANTATVIETTIATETTTREETASVETKESVNETAETETIEISTSEEVVMDTSAAEETVQNTEAVLTTASMPHSGFVFKYGNTLIGMNEDVSAALHELGSWSNYVETTSCAFKGLDKTYSYAGFDLYTYPLNGKDNVNSVYFIDDSVSTAEGIRIGSSFSDVEVAYGTNYTEEFGVYTYQKDNSTLQFIITDGIVDSIEYTAITPK